MVQGIDGGGWVATVRSGLVVAYARVMAWLSGFWEDGELGLGAGVVLAGVVAAVARSVGTVGLLPPGLAGPVIAAALLALACVAQVVMSIAGAIRALPGRSDAVRVGANLILTLVSVGVYVETFALITACVWRARGIPVTAVAGLWRAESFYLWHLADSVPLAKIPETLGWSVPAFAAAHTPAGLVLAFEVLVLVPLVRAGLAGYQLVVEVESVRASHMARRRLRRRHSGRLRDRGWFLAVVTFPASALAAAAATWVFAAALDPGSSVARWWASVLHAVHADGPGLRPWTAAIPGLAVLALMLWAWNIVTDLAGLGPYLLMQTRSWGHATAIMGGGLALLYSLVLWTAGLMLVLAGIGYGPPLPPATTIDSLTTTLLWHVASELPGPSIPSTLSWTAPLTIPRGLPSWMLLGLKLTVLAMIVFNAIPAIRVATIRTRYGPLLDVWVEALDAADVIAHDRRWPTGASAVAPYRVLPEQVAAAVDELLHQPRFNEVSASARDVVAALTTAGAADAQADGDALRAQVAAALLAYRFRMIVSYPGAAGMFDELPEWLSEAESASGGPSPDSDFAPDHVIAPAVRRRHRHRPRRPRPHPPPDRQASRRPAPTLTSAGWRQPS